MPLGEKVERMTSAQRRAWRLKKTGSEIKKTGTSRAVGSKGKVKGKRSGISVDGKSYKKKK